MCHVHEIQEDICNQEFQRLKIDFLASNFSKTTKSKPFTHYAAQPRNLNNNESNKIDWSTSYSLMSQDKITPTLTDNINSCILRDSIWSII